MIYIRSGTEPEIMFTLNISRISPYVNQYTKLSCLIVRLRVS